MNPIKTPRRKGQTLAQVLYTLYIIVLAVNEHNKKKQAHYRIIPDEIIKGFKKEIHTLSNDNEYMNSHIYYRIEVINDVVNSKHKTLRWLEDYIKFAINRKGKTKFLKDYQWKELLQKVYDTDVQIEPPLKELRFKIY
jgi:hypothetical protein